MNLNDGNDQLLHDSVDVLEIFFVVCFVSFVCFLFSFLFSGHSSEFFK